MWKWLADSEYCDNKCSMVDEQLSREASRAARPKHQTVAQACDDNLNCSNIIAFHFCTSNTFQLNLAKLWEA